MALGGRTGWQRKSSGDVDEDGSRKKKGSDGHKWLLGRGEWEGSEEGSDDGESIGGGTMNGAAHMKGDQSPSPCQRGP